MEKIFKDCRYQVLDNGFSDNIMRQITQQIPEPKKNIYRTPTLIASLCSAAVIIIVSLTVDMSELSRKYEQLVTNYKGHQYEKYAKNDIIDYSVDFHEKELETQESDFQGPLINH